MRQAWIDMVIGQSV